MVVYRFCNVFLNRKPILIHCCFTVSDLEFMKGELSTAYQHWVQFSYLKCLAVNYLLVKKKNPNFVVLKFEYFSISFNKAF